MRKLILKNFSNKKKKYIYCNIYTKPKQIAKKNKKILNKSEIKK